MPQIFSQKRDFIDVLSDDKQKIYSFNIPSGTSLGEIYDVLSYLRSEIWKTLEENKKTEDAKKVDKCCKEKETVLNVTEAPEEHECKAALHEKTPEEKKKEMNEKVGLNETLLGKDKK